MRRLFPALLVLLAFLLTLPARGDDKAIEQRLKQEYEDKLVRVQTGSEHPGMKFEWPFVDERSVDATTRVYLAVRNVRWRTGVLELTASRVFFYQDIQRKVRRVDGDETKYRVKWSPPPDEAQFLEQVSHILLRVDPEREDWSDFWPPELPAKPPGEQVGSKPSVEIAPGVFTLGNDVTQPMCEVCGEPEYPEDARAEKISGTTKMYALVTETGHVPGIRITESADARLDRASVIAASRWRFKPALRNGRAVRVVFLVETYFKLY